MTKEEIAEIYAKLFVSTKDKEEAASQIVDRLNSLKNSKDEPVTLQTKKEILKLINEFLDGSRVFKYQDGGKILIVEQQDNSKFLAMVANITSQLSSGK